MMMMICWIFASPFPVTGVPVGLFGGAEASAPGVSVGETGVAVVNPGVSDGVDPGSGVPAVIEGDG